MNNNSSKQMLLSVIGVAVLVVAVVGVSFAFFTYTRTGSQDNVIRTGTLTFAFEDTSYINLSNQFPIKTATGNGLTGENNICEFTVSGNAPTGTNITYDVFAIKGGALSGADASRTLLGDNEVFVSLNVKNGTGFTPSSDAITTGKAFGTIANGLLGTGTITGDGSATDKVVSFIARMWVDDSAVHVGNVADDNDATTEYTPEAYASKYFTMRIRVDARA